MVAQDRRRRAGEDLQPGSMRSAPPHSLRPRTPCGQRDEHAERTTQRGRRDQRPESSTSASTMIEADDAERRRCRRATRAGRAGEVDAGRGGERRGCRSRGWPCRRGNTSHQAKIRDHDQADRHRHHDDAEAPPASATRVGTVGAAAADRAGCASRDDQLQMAGAAERSSRATWPGRGLHSRPAESRRRNGTDHLGVREVVRSCRWSSEESIAASASMRPKLRPRARPRTGRALAVLRTPPMKSQVDRPPGPASFTFGFSTPATSGSASSLRAREWRSSPAPVDIRIDAAVPRDADRRRAVHHRAARRSTWKSQPSKSTSSAGTWALNEGAPSRRDRRRSSTIIA